ncbi:GH23537 [Drosophila grimshawi]|uniref:GH23537 n=1 Tax=Drosophila grimshawi TaxID=7222 RepID=B4K3Z4_DROGR|nr:GH23537 [Drosophila grimshawi]
MAFMNVVAFVALLLMSVNAQYDDAVTASQLHVTPIDGETPDITAMVPVFFARDLLKDLKLFNLIGEVEQARHDCSANGFVFQMSNPLQAEQVMKAWATRPGELTKQMQVHLAREECPNDLVRKKNAK